MNLFHVQGIVFALLFSLPRRLNSRSGVTQHALLTTVRTSRFFREKASALSSLVDSRRLG